MNGIVLNGNFCSMLPINVTVPNFGGQIFPELSLPTFTRREQSAVNLLEALDEYR
jgi:hypothetical protein